MGTRWRTSGVSTMRTQGRGAFTMHFGQYEEVPKSLAEEIVNKALGKVSR